MTATSSDRDALIAACQGSPLDRTPQLVYADWCDEYGDPATAAALRAGTWQVTQEGDRIVVVGRDGADHDNYGNGIYTTKVYEAGRRQRDGRLTWRLAYAVRMHRTAGKKVTQPMIDRAAAYAAEHGLPVAAHITHGTVCV